MPRVEDIFAKLGKARCYTTLDLRSRYHHIDLGLKNCGKCQKIIIKFKEMNSLKNDRYHIKTNRKV